MLDEVLHVHGYSSMKSINSSGKSWTPLTLIQGAHTLIDFIHQAACQVFNVLPPLFALLPAAQAADTPSISALFYHGGAWQ